MLASPPKSLKIPYTDRYGNNYLIALTVIPTPIVEVVTPIVDITLSRIHSKCHPDFSSLIGFSNIILQYFKKYDAILYFNCDHAEIDRSEKNQNLSPQEYRHRLFKALSRRICKQEGYIENNVILTDLDNVCHFITLITRAEKQHELETLSRMIKDIENKDEEA